MFNLTNFEIEKLIIAVFAGIIYPLLTELINIKFNYQSKFSLKSIIDAIFNMDSYYSGLIKKLNPYPQGKFIIYEFFILLLIPFLYYGILSYVTIIISFFLGVLIGIKAIYYIKCLFKNRREEYINDFKEKDTLLNIIRRKYKLNNILSCYIIIWGIYVTFFLINYNQGLIFYCYQLIYIFFFLILPILIILIVELVINYFTFLSNIINKIKYINIAFGDKSCIIVKLVLTYPSNINITGELLSIGLKSLYVRDKEFKFSVDYKKIAFIETKIKEKN